MRSSRIGRKTSSVASAVWQVAVMPELSIPVKLIRQCKMTLKTLLFLRRCYFSIWYLTSFEIKRFLIMRDVTAAFSALEWESIKMVSTSRDIRYIGSHITADNYSYFRYSHCICFFNLAPPLSPKMMSFCRSSVGSLLPTSATMISIGNWVTEICFIRQN